MNDKKNNGVFKTTLMFTVIGGLIVMIAIYLQLVQMNDNNKVNLTYKIYQDMESWEKGHPDAYKWIKFYDDKDSVVYLKNNFDKWDFDDYLGFYEALYNLEQKNLIDKKLTYDLFSSELQGVYESNHFELKRLTDTFRIQEKAPDIYLGVEKLYNEFTAEEKANSVEHSSVQAKK